MKELLIDCKNNLQPWFLIQLEKLNFTLTNVIIHLLCTSVYLLQGFIYIFQGYRIQGPAATEMTTLTDVKRDELMDTSNPDPDPLEDRGTV